MMKKLFIIFFICFFIGCSTDSSSAIELPNNPVQNEPEEMEEEEEIPVHLLKVIQNRYDGADITQKIEFIYQNNKLAVDSFYNSSQQLIFVQKWIYDENGLLAETEGYLPNGTLQNKNTYEYDNLGRLTKRISSEEEGAYLTEVSFSYNNDNTITAVSNSQGGNSEKTFYINEDGLIYKEEFNTSVVEVTYDGKSVLSVDFNGNRTSYRYDTMNLPLGPFKDPLAAILGNNKNNIVLWGYSLFDQASGLDGRFLLESQDADGGITKSEYIFDDQGYPLSMKRFSNAELISEFIYVYE